MSEELFPGQAPDWLAPLVERTRDFDPAQIAARRVPPVEGGRRAAVLVLFGEGPDGPDILLAERSARLRNHAGQVAFPGGGIDPGDSGPVGAALREAEEETGLAASGVVPLSTLSDLFVPPSGFVVTPVLAHWARPVAVRAVDPGETARVARVPLAQLADPANRISVRHPSGGTGPAFLVPGLFVWGFTGGLLSALLHAGGWERPWTPSRTLSLAEALDARGDGSTGREVAGG
ncbi:NUDIX hydrolase [Pseudonocardia sp. D17]|uniref:NUDIX hydrolase n=1 Tax=Pseudonocardia sp. D17 TaxID=882661 RepID=UPI002B3EF6C2|nr:coenzyme A pyrophosphatase [Pseudonocardia sp. D17]